MKSKVAVTLFMSISLMIPGVQAQDHHIFKGACDYKPQWSLFKEGNQVIDPKITTTDGSFESHLIWLPNVKGPTNTISQIQLHTNDVVMIDACGCVQTGGSGKTWKRIVDPSGRNSDRLYHGLINVGRPSDYDLKESPCGRGFVRFKDLIAKQDLGFKLKIQQDGPLVLGYEDDGYSDNGYWGHDDGNNDQCKNVGGAAVYISIWRAR